MSYSEEDLKKVVRSAVREELEQKQEPETSQKQQPQESFAQHILGCADCYVETVKGMEKMKETSDYFCDGCDLPLGSKEMSEKIEACPRCGSKKARKRVE